jgi:hypothetical protein
MAPPAAKNCITKNPASKCPPEKASIPCAIIFGISILIPLPSNAIIINKVTIPEYGLSKLNIPGLGIVPFADRMTGLPMFIAIFYKGIQLSVLFNEKMDIIMKFSDK